MAHRRIDAAVDAEGEAIAGRGDLVERLVEPIGRPTHDMQDRAEDLAGKAPDVVDLPRLRREEGAVRGAGRQRAAVEEAGFASGPRGMRSQRFFRGRIDDRADIGREHPRVARF
jgi:hypothetical protein